MQVANTHIKFILHLAEYYFITSIHKKTNKSMHISTYIDSHKLGTPVTKHVSAPIDRPVPSTTGGLPPGQNICSNCERLIM